jgi:hypothetical protein
MKRVLCQTTKSSITLNKSDLFKPWYSKDFKKLKGKEDYVEKEINKDSSETKSVELPKVTFSGEYIA